MKPAVGIAAHAAVLPGFYFVSGAIAICYEILWSRYLALQFGISIYGVVVTVAAFMFGLGAGSLGGNRLLCRWRRPLRVFAGLELLVALFALTMPLLFRQLGDAMTALAPLLGRGQWQFLHTLMMLVLLFVPACAMGLGFPAILHAARRQDAAVGRLYGFNALGGVLGALLPLLLLPALGWVAANSAVALVGLALAASAWWYDRRLTLMAPAAVNDDTASGALAWGSLLSYAAVGASALALEIAWTRLFGMVLLRTEYVLAVILASFLSGIALGSLLARRLRQRHWLGVLPVLLCATGLAGLWLYPMFSAWLEATRFASLGGALTVQGGLLFLLTLPVTLVLGAWLPLLTARAGGGARTGALLYGVNSLGAGLGVLVSGWLLVPWLGTSAVVVVALLALLLLGLSWSGDRRWYAALLLLLPLAWPLWSLPPATALLPAALPDSRDLAVTEDAVGITHVIADADGQRLLLSDLQRMDASTAPEAVTLQRNQLRLPLLLHPDPHALLLLGLGTGISASVLNDFPLVDATAVELSAGAIAAAATWFKPVNHGVLDRLHVVRDDARHFLMAASGPYDLILGDLFHPDLAGRGALLSRQQFSRAGQLLAPGGLFVQWLSLNQFDLASLQSVLATFADSFPRNYLFLDGFRVAMVGVREGTIDAAALATRYAALPVAQQQALSGGEGLWTWLGRYLGPIPGVAVPLQDEWAPVIEYRLPRARYAGALDVASVSAWLASQRVSGEQARRQLRIPEAAAGDFDRARQATAQAHQGWLAIFTGGQRAGQIMLQQALQQNAADHWIAAALAQALWDQLAQARRQGADVQQVFGHGEAEVLAAVLKLQSDHPQALKALWRQAQAQGQDAEAAAYRARLQAIAPLDRALGDNITY